MNSTLPEYLTVPAEKLGEGIPVKVRIVGDAHQLALDMAEAMLRIIRECLTKGRQATLIVPVGPVDQFPILAKRINEVRLDCREVMLINMDEYLTDDDQWVPVDHPLSFRGFMHRKFYNLVDPKLAPRSENRIFPDPHTPDRIAEVIALRGGVDACFGGIGINCHIAFNEPPEPGESMTAEEFAALSSRVLNLARETRKINSVTVGGDINVIPRRGRYCRDEGNTLFAPTAILL